jgi:uncharacterized membrane protein
MRKFFRELNNAAWVLEGLFWLVMLVLLIAYLVHGGPL